MPKHRHLNSPFSIFATPRPKRIAFLIDPENCSDELMDAIFNFNLLHWGGRYNPIIPVSNKTISTAYWELLKFCDPDVIYSFPKLTKGLIQKIDRWISPFHFIYHKDYPTSKPRISITNAQLGNEYFVNHIEKTRIAFLDEPILLVCRNSNEWKHHRFFHRNFGVYCDREVFSPQLSPRTKTLVIDENSEPDKFFSQMATIQRLVFPIQFSEMGADFQEDLNSSKHDNFCIVIGNTPWDWIYFWNRIFLLSRWRRELLSQICIPLSFIESEQIMTSLKKFLPSQLYRTNSQSPTVLFVSHDIAEDKLEQISKKITEGINAYPSIKQLEKHSFPTIKPCDSSQIIQNSTRDFHVYGEKVFINNPKPTFLGMEAPKNELFSGGKTWMLDLKVEYRPERFFYTNTTYWWRFPKRGGISELFANRSGRITNDGLISIEVNEGDKNIELNIPDDNIVIRSVLIRKRINYYYTNDVREKKVVIPYGDLCISDKGRYVRGFIELFPSLWHASDFVNNRYWRNILESLCRIDIVEEDKKIKPIKEKLDRILPNFVRDYSKNPEEKKQWLARYILNQAKKQKSVAMEIDFDTLLDKLNKERHDFKLSKEDHKDFNITKKENKQSLIDAMSYLTEQSIFFQGVKPQCSVCGSSFWYHVEEIKSNMVCKGCKSRFSLPIQSNWIYRLNELVVNAVGFHGVIPVVWTLGHLLSNCGDSFIFTPSTVLFKNYSSKRPLAEIDLVCISDNNLIIGEVKPSTDEFNSAKIEKLVSKCKHILPEKAIIAAFQGTHDKLDDFADELSKKLKSFGIKVEAILPNPDIFEPVYYIQ